MSSWRAGWWLVIGPAVGVVAALVVPAGAALPMVLLLPPSESLMATPVRLSVWIAATAGAVLVVRRRYVASAD